MRWGGLYISITATTASTVGWHNTSFACLWDRELVDAMGVCMFWITSSVRVFTLYVRRLVLR